MKRIFTITTRRAVLLGLVLFSISSLAAAQNPKSLTESSYQRAARILNDGVKALGGLDRFREIENMSFKATASIPEPGQSVSAGGPAYVRLQETFGVIDLKRRKNYRLNKTNFTGGAEFSISLVTTDRSGFTADLGAHAVYPLAAAAVANTNRVLQRAFPHLLLQTALNRTASLRSLGDVRNRGELQHVITFADTDGTQITLYFSAKTGLLTGNEILGDRFLEGFGAAETIFTDYRLIDEVKIPFHVITRFAGEVISDLKYNEVHFNAKLDEALFEPSPNSEIGPEVGGPAQPITLTKLGNDVYYVNAVGTGGIFFYSSMFVAFKDYVLVVEAPVNDAVSQAVIARIKEVAPGKPIKYLVPTHHHVDHLGGVRGYIAEGSTIVTTPGDQRFIENIASVAHPLNPDRLSQHPQPLKLETFTSKKVFSDSEHVVELYNLGPCPHADEIVIAYLPKEKLAFASDLFPVTFKGKLSPISPVFVFFEQKVREMGLQIETVASGHGRVGRMEELRELLAGSEKKSNKSQ